MIADTVAKRLRFEVRSYSVNWTIHGRAAGPIRNQQMLGNENPELLIAFWDMKSKGTADMIARAEKAGIPVEIHNIVPPHHEDGYCVKDRGPLPSLRGWDTSCDATKVGLERMMRALIVCGGHFTSSFNLAGGPGMDLRKPQRGATIFYRIWIPEGTELEFMEISQAELKRPPKVGVS